MSSSALKEAGFMRAVLPRRWGGLEATPQEFFAAILKIAEQDMSSAWIAGIVAVHAYQLGADGRNRPRPMSMPTTPIP